MHFEQWFDLNDDRLSEAWFTHLCELEDSWEHKRYLAQNDKAFAEFAAEAYEAEVKEKALK